MLALNLAESVDNSRRNRIRLEDLTIVAGGQTGAPRAAIDFAIARQTRYAHSNLAGCEAEGIPMGARPLRATQRHSPFTNTESKVVHSDGTAVFSISDHLSAGALDALNFAQWHEKPWIYLPAARKEDAPARLWRFIQDNHIRILNVAGSEACDEPEVGKYVTATFDRMFTSALIYVVQRYRPGLLRGRLERAIEPPCVARVFSHPSQALQSFAAEPRKPDLLITELVLEGMLWHQLVLECKALNPSLKVILYSAAIRSRSVKSLIEKTPVKPDALVKRRRALYPAALLAETQKLLRFTWPTS